MKLYYAYENWTARAYRAHDVTVHLHECAHCPFDADGMVRPPGRGPRSGRRGADRGRKIGACT